MDNQAYEINLKQVIYRICSKWRGIIVFAICAGLLLGGLFAWNSFSFMKNEDAYQKALLSYQLDHDGWESRGVVYNDKIEDLQISRDRQLEYNEKSILMKIDPMNEFVGSFSLYVDSGYQLDPTLGMQNIDYTQRILSAYSRYLHGGELYEYILDNTDIVDEQKYLKEILSSSTDSDSAMINVTVNGASAEDVQEIIDLIKQGISQKYETINSTVGSHTYSIIYETAYSFVNYNLQDEQKENEDRIARLNTSLQSANEQLTEWKKEIEPKFDYSKNIIIKRSIVRAILGAVGGGLLSACLLAFKDLFGYRFSSDKLGLCTDKRVRIIGDVNYSNSGKVLKGLDRLFASLFGQQTDMPTFKDSCELTGSVCQSMAHVLKADSIALVGHVDPELMGSIVSAMKDQLKECEFSILGDILEQPNAVSKLEQYDNVAVVLQEKKNSLENVSRQFELLDIWKKNILGAIIVK